MPSLLNRPLTERELKALSSNVLVIPFLLPSLMKEIADCEDAAERSSAPGFGAPNTNPSFSFTPGDRDKEDFSCADSSLGAEAGPLYEYMDTSMTPTLKGPDESGSI